MPHPLNQPIAELLKELCQWLELSGENPFRIRAYATAARTLEALDRPLAELAARGQLQSIQGIGPGLAGLIASLIETGTAPELEELKSSLPAGLIQMLRIPGLGPKKVRAIHLQLGLDTLEALGAACREGRLAALSGFGAKSQENILRGLEQLQRYLGLFHLDTAWRAAHSLCETLAPLAAQLEVAGSLRRFAEVVDGVELVVCADQPETLLQALRAHPLAQSAPAANQVLLKDKLPATLHLVAKPAFAPGLLHRTGNAAHLEALAARAETQGLRLEASGIFRGNELVPCGGEEAIYAALGLQYIPPELREGRGEVEAAARHALPSLVQRHDLKGALHVHTTYSDGRHTLEEMARAARARGYAYLGICDHSRSAAYARGLQIEDLRRQGEEIARLNEQLAPFRIFAGVESDILAGGELDYPDEVLESLDLVVVSVHSRFNLGREEMTRRLCRALEHPCAAILGHATGRLLLEREPYELDVEAVIETAAAHQVAIELNANPYRLDLDWRYLRQASDKGVPIALNTDAHAIEQLEYDELGAALARKAWLQPSEVLNTKSAAELAGWLAARKVPAAE
jgi:DNA polymerase (family 10)